MVIAIFPPLAAAQISHTCSMVFKSKRHIYLNTSILIHPYSCIHTHASILISINIYPLFNVFLYSPPVFSFLTEWFITSYGFLLTSCPDPKNDHNCITISYTSAHCGGSYSLCPIIEKPTTNKHASSYQLLLCLLSRNGCFY